MEFCFSAKTNGSDNKSGITASAHSCGARLGAGHHNDGTHRLAVPMLYAKSRTNHSNHTLPGKVATSRSTANYPNAGPELPQSAKYGEESVARTAFQQT